MKRNQILRMIVAALFCLTMASSSFASVMTLPSETKVIEAEAFYGSTDIDEVVLPQGIQEIHSKAFSQSGIRKINLPSSLNYIADDAFDRGSALTVTAEEGTYAWQWAADHGFFTPPQPEFIFSDPDLAFSPDAENAPVYAPGAIELSWQPIPDAAYSLTLERTDGEDLIPVLSREGISDNGYILQSSLFDGLTETAVYRISLSAKIVKTGPAAQGYFAVRPISELLINGESSARWERPMKTGGSRTFSVESEMTWTAEADAAWMTVLCGENEVNVTVSGNPDTSETRTGHVTVSNGIISRTITVVQGALNEASRLTYNGIELSTDPNNPTLIPEGPFEVGIVRDIYAHTLVQIFKKQYGIFPSFPYYWFRTSGTAFTTSSGFSFRAGDVLRLRASDHLSTDVNNYALYETAGDAPFREYYVTMVSKDE